jgi:hypothetical protein
LLNKVAGEKKASIVDEIFSMIGGKWAKDSLGESIVPVICSKVQDNLPKKMKASFDEKGLNCEITVKPDCDEAEFFFSCINEHEQ